jgi:2-haloacid dehalogenase
VTPPPTTVVFDLGNVLIPWDPRSLYRKVFPGDPAAMEWFLANVCTHAWNQSLDGGRPFRDGIAELVARHPEHAAAVRAWDERWEEMLGDPFPESVDILDALAARGVPLYALTNWSAEKFPIARRRYGFLGRFRGIVVSGEERLHKPDPAIFHRLLARFGLTAPACVFVDDSQENVDAASRLGFRGIRFASAPPLRAALKDAGLL